MEKLNLITLNQAEQINIYGGNRFKKGFELIRNGLEIIGAIDAYHSFIEGWNSVECSQN